MFDHCCLHALTPEDEGDRTFFRLIYAARPYDRQGNTVNTLFAKGYEEAGWQLEPQPLPLYLLPPLPPETAS
jgi:hypothetical protein